MDARARMTSKGQVTIPRAVRDALALQEGDEVVFRVESSRALMAKTPNFLELAGRRSPVDRSRPCRMRLRLGVVLRSRAPARRRADAFRDRVTDDPDS